MKINNITTAVLYFKGQRQDRRTIKQLSENNDYDLNLINQRRITNAIDNLAEVSGEDNVKFLLETAENLKYTTNIDLGKSSYNNWKEKLHTAVEKSLSKSDIQTQEKLKERVENVFSKTKPLTEEENEILDLRKSLLDTIDYKLLEKIPNQNIKNIKRNLDYFIISSEVPLVQKHYILKRLNYFMSPEYKINEQLADKKTQALAEIINDLVINTPESEIPNIKAVDQGHSGTCASISICRKLLAYEDKVNYTDIILSELDANDYMEIYDITKLGTHTKIKVPKVYVDYEYALENGSRILDAGTAYWMNIADMTGADNEQVVSYNPYDRENFDTFHDTHLNKDLPEEYIDKQDYFKALIKTEYFIKDYKKNTELKKIRNTETYNNRKFNPELIIKYKNALIKILMEYDTSYAQNPNRLNSDINALINQEKKIDESTKKISDRENDSKYISKDSDEFKLRQIKKLLTTPDTTPLQKEYLDKNAKNILEITNEIRRLNKTSSNSVIKKEYIRAKKLYQIAGAYRTQQVFSLDIPEYREDLMISLNIPDDETRMIVNIDKLLKKIKDNTLNPEIKRRLAQNFQTENTNEALEDVLENAKKNILYIKEFLMDDFFASVLQVNKKFALAIDLLKIKEAINEEGDKNVLIDYASRLGVKENKKVINEKLDKFIEILKTGECSEEEYTKIFNRLGNKSILQQFKEKFEFIGEMLFEDENEDMLKGFKLINGLEKEANMEEVKEAYKKIAEHFNEISQLLCGYENALRITDENNNVLNSTTQKDVILKKMENMGEIISERELRILQTKLSKISKATTATDSSANQFDKLPPELKTYTPEEKEILKKIENNINGWKSTITRRLNTQYLDLKDQLYELSREIGIKTGDYWVSGTTEGGLQWKQQIKIIEAMTDRPYYMKFNGDKAIEQLKDSPYSGISGLSMDINEPAFHAQYIADIAPVKVKENGKTVSKDTIFHDNTWGPIEHERVWEDETGNLRTDYRREYGLPSGFVTDGAYKNGVIADELFNTKGEISTPPNRTKLLKKLDNEYYGDFSIFSNIVIPGKYKNINSSIHDLKLYLTNNPSTYLDDLENMAHQMTRAQIKNTTEKINNSIDKIYSEYDDILRRLKTEFYQYNVLISQDAYDKIPNNNTLKLLLEKTALLNSYPNIPENKNFYQSLKDNEMGKIKQYIQDEARINFEYSFGKSIKISNYATESTREYLNKALEEFSQENNLKLTQTKINKIIDEMKKIPTEEFDGSLDHTADLLTQRFKSELEKETQKIENKSEKLEQMANNLKHVLKTNMGFTLADLDSPSSETEHFKNIAKWIDDNFNPATDEEFVQIYNKLQNMTTNEFRKIYGSKITNEALGIEKLSGYDILKQLDTLTKSAENKLFNIVFYQKLYSNLNMATNTKPAYEYKKFERNLNGMYYKDKRTFEDIYYDYYNSLSNLTGTEKTVNKYKQQNFEKYRVLPAFPKIQIEEKEKIDEALNDLFNDLYENMEFYLTIKNKIQTFKLLRNFKNYTNRLDIDKPLEPRQYNTIINKYLTKFLSLNDGDETIEKQIDAVKTALQNAKEASDFKTLANQLLEELKPYEITPDGETLETSLKETVKSIKNTEKEFILYLIDPKYHKKAYEILNKWISAKIKTGDESKLDYYQEKSKNYCKEFYDLFSKKNIFNSPEKMLNDYLLMNAQDAKPEDFNIHSKNQETSAQDFEQMKDAYKTTIKNMLFSADTLEMQYKIMSWARNGHLNMIKQEMSNTNMELKDGSSTTLDSYMSLNSILGRMMKTEDIDTALMFINQLGLGETVMNMIDDSKNIENSRKNLIRITTILKNAEKQVHIAKEELSALKEYENSPEFFDKLSEAKQNIINRIKNTKYKKISHIYSKIIDKTISELEANPKLPKFAMLETNMDIAKQAVVAIVQNDINELNRKLFQIQLIYNLICNISLPEQSPANKLREKFKSKYKELEDLSNGSLHKHYEELGLDT